MEQEKGCYMCKWEICETTLFVKITIFMSKWVHSMILDVFDIFSFFTNFLKYKKIYDMELNVLMLVINTRKLNGSYHKLAAH